MKSSKTRKTCFFRFVAPGCIPDKQFLPSDKNFLRIKNSMSADKAANRLLVLKSQLQQQVKVKAQIISFLCQEVPDIHDRACFVFHLIKIVQKIKKIIPEMLTM